MFYSDVVDVDSEYYVVSWMLMVECRLVLW